MQITPLMKKKKKKEALTMFPEDKMIRIHLQDFFPPKMSTHNQTWKLKK